jgi:DNA modification methylase
MKEENNLPKPYYDHAGITLYHGDCRQILPMLGRFDLLLTDPPYGIGADNQKQILSREKIAKAKDYGCSNWDNSTVDLVDLKACIDKASKAIVWGGNYYELPPCAGPLIWDKENGCNDFADGELAWNNLGTALRIKRHLWKGMLRKGKEQRDHPTQKPLDVIQWCISLAGDIKTILDPYAGSGTTGVAAKNLGRKCVMIEREERYCEIAANRLSQEVLAL